LITGHKRKRIKRLYTDEGLIHPEKHESYWGVPGNMHPGCKEPHIEVEKDEKVIATINCGFVFRIDFENEESNT